MKKSITTILILSLIFLLKSNDSIAGDLYKWVDENGVTHFSDSPTDRGALEKGNSRTMPAFERVEPINQVNVITVKNGSEGFQNDHEVTTSAVETYNSMATEINKKNSNGRDVNNERSGERTQVVKNSNDNLTRVVDPNINQAGNMAKKSIASKNNSVSNNRTYYPLERKQNSPKINDYGNSKNFKGISINQKTRLDTERYNAKNRKENERQRKEYERKKREIEQLNAKIAAENEKRRREYEIKKNEIDQYNQRVKKHNQQIQRARYNREKKKAEEKYHKRKNPSVNRDYGRKPYLSDSYHDMMRN